MKKIDLFLKFLETTSLDKGDKKSLISMIDFLYGKYIPELSDKSFLLEGEPGIGKTYLTEKLIESIDLPILFLGQSNLKNKNIEKVSSLANLIKKLDNFEQGIIFIDDLRYSLKFDNELDGLQDDEKRRFMILLEHLKRANKRIVMIMTLNSSDFIDDSCIDRIEVKIEFNLPSEENKLSFLKENYSKYAKTNELKYITRNSIGYNYRDLPQLIKIAYREGDRNINMEGIKKALSLYNPSGLKRWNVKREIKTRFKHVIGQDHVKKELEKLMLYLKQNKKLHDLGIKQSNLIIFSGDPGVGKTYMTTALAGELNLPLVKINAVDIHGDNPLRNMGSIMHMAKRFRNSVIFIDDIDKLIGRGPISFDEEGPLISQFNVNVEEEGVQGIIVLAVNSINRLGRALKDRFSVIKFDNPSFENRKEFAKRLIEKGNLNLNIDEDFFARVTENMNYRQMQRIWNDCIFYYLQNNTMDQSIFTEFISETRLNANRQNMFG